MFDFEHMLHIASFSLLKQKSMQTWLQIMTPVWRSRIQKGHSSQRVLATLPLGLCWGTAGLYISKCVHQNWWPACPSQHITITWHITWYPPRKIIFSTPTFPLWPEPEMLVIMNLQLNWMLLHARPQKLNSADCVKNFGREVEWASVVPSHGKNACDVLWWWKQCDRMHFWGWPSPTYIKLPVRLHLQQLKLLASSYSVTLNNRCQMMFWVHWKSHEGSSCELFCFHGSSWTSQILPLAIQRGHVGRLSKACFARTSQISDDRQYYLDKDAPNLQLIWRSSLSPWARHG